MKLYDQHRKPVAKAYITGDTDGEEMVYVRVFCDKALFQDSVVPLKVFNNWKTKKGLKEEVDIENLNLWERDEK